MRAILRLFRDIAKGECGGITLKTDALSIARAVIPACLRQADARKEGHDGSGRPESPPSSFRRRPESSGLFNTFPQSGNDKRVTSADRGKSQFVSHPASALLDSSLRWNDDEEKKGGLPSDNPFAIPAECLTPAPRHSGEGRNPVLDTTHSRKAGMTLGVGIRSVWHRRAETGCLWPLGPPSWIPAFAGMTTGRE